MKSIGASFVAVLVCLLHILLALQGLECFVEMQAKGLSQQNIGAEGLCYTKNQAFWDAVGIAAIALFGDVIATIGIFPVAPVASIAGAAYRKQLRARWPNWLLACVAVKQLCL